MKRVKKWKRFIALLVVLALVIQCNFNAIALDSNEEKQQQAGAVVEEMMAEETATEAKTEEPKQETVEEKKDEPQEKQEMVEKTEELKEETKQEVTEEKKEEPKQETAEEKKEESKQETAEAKQEAAKEDEQKEIAEEKSQEEKEEKEEAKTSFSYFDNRVSIQATADKKANFPQNTVLKADYVKPGSAEYKQAAALAESKYGEDGKELEFVFYDIYFESDGERIEPEAGNVTVTVDFKKAVLPDSEETESSTHEVIHINGSNVEKVTDQVTTNDQGAATSIKFTSDSFSVFGDMKVSTLLDESEEYDMDVYGMFREDNPPIIQVKINGEWEDITKLGQETTIPKDSSVRVILNYYPGDIHFNVGDTITYKLKDIVPEQNDSGDVMDGPQKVGSYLIEKDFIDTDGKKITKISITIENETYLKASNGILKEGMLMFEGKFSNEFISNPGDDEIVFGEIHIDIPFTPEAEQKKADLNITKAVIQGTDEKDIQMDNKGYYIDYLITVSTPSENELDIEDVSVKDTISSGSDYVNNIEVIENPTVGTFNPETKEWTDIGTMTKGQSYSMEIRVRLKDNICLTYDSNGNLQNNTITNGVEAYSGETKKAEDFVSSYVNAGLNITKTNSGYDANTKQIQYTVTVTAPETNSWTLEHVKVDDIFDKTTITNNYKTGYDYITGYDLSKTTMTSNKQEGRKGTVTYSTSKSLEWNIEEMKPGETATLVYYVNISDEIYGRTDSTSNDVKREIYNKATVKVDGNEKGSAWSNVPFRKVWIWKSGSLQNDGKVKFTIHANESTGDGPIIDQNLTFRDYLTNSDWVYDGLVTVTWYNQGPNNKGTAQGSTSFRVDENTFWEWSNKDNSGAYYYEFEYYARLKDNVIGKPSISNKAEIGIPGGDGKTYWHEHKWSGTGKDYKGLNKEFLGINDENKNAVVASWKSTITNSVTVNSIFRDWSQNSGENSRSWTMTDDQKAKVIVKDQDGNQLSVDQGDGNGDYKITLAADRKSFTIQFLKSFSASTEKPITITYETTLDTNMNKGTTAIYNNKSRLTVNGHSTEAQATCTYTKEWRLDKQAGDYYPETAELTWKLKVNVTGCLDGNATIEDTLPDGLEFVKAEILPADRGNKATDTQIVEQPTVEGNKVTINLSGLVKSNDREAFVIVTLTTKVVKKDFFVSNTEETFTNNAELIYGGESSTDTATKTIKNTILTKEGAYKAPNMIYTIVVNPNGYDLLQNGSTITVVDTMGANMMLNTSTLKVSGEKSGNISITAENFSTGQDDQGQTTFTLIVPDNEKITITYNAYLKGDPGTTVSVSNTVSYSGTATESKSDDMEVKIEESKATISSEPAFYLKKMNANQEAMEDVKFELCEVKADGTIDTTNKIEKSSDENGFVYFTQLDKTKVYAFKEVETNDGFYIDDENKKYSYVAFSSAAITDEMKQKLGISANNVIQPGTTIERTNKKAQITVKKVFTGGTAPEGIYYFSLFKDKDAKEFIETKSIEVNSDGSYKEGKNTVTFTGVDVGKNGTSKDYYVYETDASGTPLSKNTDNKTMTLYQTKFTVSGEGKVTVSGESNETANKTITITNSIEELKVTLKATKKLVNESASNIKVNNFQFGLYEVKDGIIAVKPVETVTSDENGDITFPTLKYEYSKDADNNTYNYIIKEIISADKGSITYDTKEYPITISIDDKLMISVTSGKTTLAGTDDVYWLPEKTDNNQNASFINKYEPSTSIQFTGTKTLSGANYSLTDNKFQFEIEGPNLKDSGNNSVTSLTVGHDADGTIHYPEISYQLADLWEEDSNEFADSKDFTYVIKEKLPDGVSADQPVKDGITYSDATYTAVVTVTNTGTGMTASYKIGTVESPNLNFTNTYSAKATLSIPGTKTLDGAKLKEGMFSFAITETTEDVAEEERFNATVQNDENGNFEFTLPEYTQADDGKTFTYEIAEVNDGKVGFTYSPETYQVVIIVKDNLDGTLTIEQSVTKDNQETPVTFANTFRGSAELTKIDDVDGLEVENPIVLEGAEFELYQASEDGNIKIGETLTTDKDGKIIATDLVEGDYYFVEITPPKGYKIVRDENGEPVHYTFSIGPDDPNSRIYANAQLTAGNTQTKVYIRKVDADGKLLSGAKMAVIDPDTKQIVEQWTTDGTVKEITGKLIAGKTYYLSELEAPKGYLIGADVEFTVATDVDTTEVEMTDPKDEGTEKLGSLSVTKKIVSREIAGDFDLYANDATYYVGLFTDPEGNHPYGQKAIREAHIVNGSTSEPVVYENLPTGTYYVLETTKDGIPIPMNTDATDGKNSFVCEVAEGGTNAVEIDTKAEQLEGKVNLTNAYLELPDGFAYRAFIDVTKKVLENGTEQDTDETFYAGIFAGETEAVPMTVVALQNNGTVTVEVPLGGPEGNQPITYYVYETDAQGNKIDKDAFAYLVSGEGDVSVAKEKLQSDITITNNLISEVSLEILKVDEDGYGLEGAKFQITSADGKTVLKKWKSDEESKEITLAPGTYKLTETVAPEGYIKGSDVTITISKDGTISVEGDDATLNDSVIEYVNQEDDTTSKADDKKGGTSKTGDPTHIMFYAVLLAAAMLGCMAVLQRKKGRHNR